MSFKVGRDYINLIWKSPTTRVQYTVGQLSKNGQFEFNYCEEIEKAMADGFSPLVSFNEINETYTSDILFPTFSSRLPDKKRKDIEKILEKYKLDTFDEYELLKKSGAKLPIDNLFFIDPIFNLENGEVSRRFYIAGVRHYIGCEKEYCENAKKITIGDNLELQCEPENVHDKYAIKILDSEGFCIGYIPKYYSESVTTLISEGCKYYCKVIDVQKNKNCNECIYVELFICK